MHHSPFINNAGLLMPFITCCSSNIKQIFGQSQSYGGNLRWHKERGNREGRGRGDMKREFISQTVTFRSFMKGLINVIQIPISGGNCV